MYPASLLDSISSYVSFFHKIDESPVHHAVSARGGIVSGKVPVARLIGMDIGGVLLNTGRPERSGIGVQKVLVSFQGLIVVWCTWERQTDLCPVTIIGCTDVGLVAAERWRCIGPTVTLLS